MRGVYLAHLACIRAQQAGTMTPETPPAITIKNCSASGCEDVAGGATIDANWRWSFDPKTKKNCYTGNLWDPTLCPTGAACATNCALDGASYKDTYGVTTTPNNGLKLAFITNGPYSKNFGSRLYFTVKDKYFMFKLKNKEFSFTVDVSKLPCGLNGALYFTAMDEDGGMTPGSASASGDKGTATGDKGSEAGGKGSESGDKPKPGVEGKGGNLAGAKYGTGYCDAQCPQDVKWIGGSANSDGWIPSKTDPNSGTGKMGACCPEVDIWEANSISQAFTPHPCKKPELFVCQGDACGNQDGGRYKAECDKDGCDFASYRWGAKEFYGPSKTVDSTKPFTVVTQFITSDGTDKDPSLKSADYGKTIKNEAVKIPGLAKPVDSITDAFCDATKKATGDINDFKAKGGMKAIDAALEKGMVLVFSLWDDHMASMNWLDSNYPPTKAATAPGVARGTCDAKVGDPDNVRAKFGDATVEFSDVKIGPIGTTSKTSGTSSTTTKSGSDSTGTKSTTDSSGTKSTTDTGNGSKSNGAKNRKACRITLAQEKPFLYRSCAPATLVRSIPEVGQNEFVSPFGYISDAPTRKSLSRCKPKAPASGLAAWVTLSTLRLLLRSPSRTAPATGCEDVAGGATIDANWRWSFSPDQKKNCYTGNLWDATLCPTGEACAANCALDGANYKDTYGVTTTPNNGLKLAFITNGPYSKNFGSRLYFTVKDKYFMFKLKNKEFSFTVDVSKLPCGLNGALYFSAMDENGGLTSGAGSDSGDKGSSDKPGAGASKKGGNFAGAKYGTGYCDAQCPQDVKWIGGKANSDGWIPSKTDPNSGTGKMGACCPEMDIWEANSVSQAFTPHPCKKPELFVCQGDACGNQDGGRYKAECDKDGCDFATYRWGAKEFYGPSKTVDSTKPFTVVTQFITSDGTDKGPLSEIRRLYVQDGKTIKNEAVKIPGLAKPADSITEGFCDATKKATGDINDFKAKGGMKAMDAALEKGMVLVFSLWDDHMASMNWLDSNYPPTKPADAFGVARGTCDAKVGDPENVRAKFGDATVEFSDVKIGPIGTTSKSDASPSPPGGGAKSKGGNKRKACRSVRY
ncbi:hypothetical protein PSTT_09512 [Puccinia striiformis]|uniref:cellulose 1,4-beta-cellobiosidase (non-reducing end) n=1 Tax=Puccinia striiformis TaxID=27350 RepID=A0A2S4V8H1_9BASI|nr:hypothetical protein PSTT_09512 [Puccinia striiformis]